MIRRQQAADRAVRLRVTSPGHPKFQAVAAVWVEIAKGLLPIEAAEVVAASQPVGQRWFHNAGGMPPFDLEFQPSGRYLSFAEREEIALLRVQGKGVREIARAISRDPGTISRELRRNAAVRYGGRGYRASVAQWKADLAAQRPKVAKLVTNPQLHAYVLERLSGQIRRPDGTVIAGPQPPRFTGNNEPHRKNRAWSSAWSPEQIANRIKLDLPDDESMRISHEAIYQSLYIEGRDALKRELVWCLRTGRALRAPRERSRRKTSAHVTPGTVVSGRPAEVEDRAVPGHWAGDLVIGLERSAVGTVVERTTRFTMLVQLPREAVSLLNRATPPRGESFRYGRAHRVAGSKSHHFFDDRKRDHQRTLVHSVARLRSRTQFDPIGRSIAEGRWPLQFGVPTVITRADNPQTVAQLSWQGPRSPPVRH